MRLAIVCALAWASAGTAAAACRPAPRLSCCGKACPAPASAPRDCCRVSPPKDEAAVPRLSAGVALEAPPAVAQPVLRAEPLPPAPLSILPAVLCNGPCGLSPPALA